MELNKYSKRLTQDETQPASQAMLYGIGLTEEQMGQPFVGIASTGYEGNTCNMHLNDLAKERSNIIVEKLDVTDHHILTAYRPRERVV